MKIRLCERLTFDKLFRISDPKRVYRSFTVHGPPLEIDSYQDTAYYCFNFKSDPSTTGLRHRGYVKFFKPKKKNPSEVPLQHLECLVDCECPDFRYRWAWANKQRGSSVVGDRSLNQALNRAPRKTNPTGAPGLCKHILAARQYIYGLLSEFSGDEPDTAEKLNKLTKHAIKRWSDFGGAMRAARERERVFNANRQARNIGAKLPVPAQVLTPKPAKPEQPAQPELALTGKPEVDDPTSAAPSIPAPPVTPTDPVSAVEPVSPEAVTPAISPASSSYTQPKDKNSKRVLGNRVVKGMLPGAQPGTWESVSKLKNDSVVSATGTQFMSQLTEAVKLIEELEVEEKEFQESPDAALLDQATGPEALDALPEPTEPPISDAAIGADTEGETALGLLRQSRDLLAQLVSAVAPEPEAAEAGAEDAVAIGAEVTPGAPGDDDGASTLPAEPPSEDDEVPTESDSESDDSRPRAPKKGGKDDEEEDVNA